MQVPALRVAIGWYWYTFDQESWTREAREDHVRSGFLPAKFVHYDEPHTPRPLQDAMSGCSG